MGPRSPSGEISVRGLVHVDATPEVDVGALRERDALRERVAALESEITGPRGYAETVATLRHELRQARADLREYRDADRARKDG